MTIPIALVARVRYSANVHLPEIPRFVLPWFAKNFNWRGDKHMKYKSEPENLESVGFLAALAPAGAHAPVSGATGMIVSHG
jgi:hypothetical protein